MIALYSIRFRFASMGCWWPALISGFHAVLNIGATHEVTTIPAHQPAHSPTRLETVPACERHHFTGTG